MGIELRLFNLQLQSCLLQSVGAILARAVRPGNFSAVTGACQMVLRDVFEQVGGSNEELAVGFNDADFCPRVWPATAPSLRPMQSCTTTSSPRAAGKRPTRINSAAGNANRRCSCSAARSSSWMVIPGSDRTYPPTVSTSRFSAK